VKQTRNIYVNALAQRTAVANGKPFMRLQSASVGEGGPVNGFSIAANTGALNLTQAEFDAVVAQETSGSSGPPGPPQLIFTYDGISGEQLPADYTVPAGYTSLAYILCGGGGAGAGKQTDGGGGGGSGGFLQGSTPVSSGQSIGISFGYGGLGGTDANDSFGDTTDLFVGTDDIFSASGGGGGRENGDGGDPGDPSGERGDDRSSLPGGYKGGDGATGGGGGGGGGCGNVDDENGAFGNGENGAANGSPGENLSVAGSGGDGFYRLTFT